MMIMIAIKYTITIMNNIILLLLLLQSQILYSVY